MTWTNRTAAVVLALVVSCSGNEWEGGDGTPEDAGVEADVPAPDGGQQDADREGDDGGGPDSPLPDDAGQDQDGDQEEGSGISPSEGSGGDYPGHQTRTASAATGAFEYYIYVPTSYEPSSAMPLLVVFHGQGDTGENMGRYWSSTAEAEGFLVLAFSSSGASGGWVPSTAVARLNASMADATAAYNVELARLYVWGFSAGAHLVHSVALDNPDIFAAYSVSAGILQALAGTGAPAAAARLRRIPVDIHFGDSDPMRASAESDRATFIAAGWAEGGTLRFVEFAGGHTLDQAHLPEIWDFLEGWTLPVE